MVSGEGGQKQQQQQHPPPQKTKQNGKQIENPRALMTPIPPLIQHQVDAVMQQ